MSTLTIAQALTRARERGVERLDAQLLLAAVLARPRTWLLANDNVVLSAEQARIYAGLLARRARGEPLAYLLGEKEFHGLTLRVDASVLVPRPDTETLVDWGLELLRGQPPQVPGSRVVDLGTGSGAIALAVKHAFPAAEVTALDASKAALRVARANAQRLGLDLRLLASDWWAALPGHRFHLVLSNPPYVAEGDPHLRQLAHEPAMALVSGPDGLDSIRHIVVQAADHMEPGGWLLLEHGHDQAGAVHALLDASGFSNVQSRRDLGGVTRCTGGRFAPR